MPIGFLVTIHWRPSGDLLVRAGTTTSSAPLARLEAEIESLAGDGSLIGGQANALLKKLEAFQMQAEAGRTGPAMALINALMNQVEDFVADGVLTPEQGQALTALAVGVRNTIDPGIVRIAYAPNTLGDDVSVLDLATGTVTGSISVGSSPNAAVFTPDGSTAYVANSGDDNLSVIDVATATVSTTIPAGDGPTELAFSLDGTELYVVHLFGDALLAEDRPSQSRACLVS